MATLVKIQYFCLFMVAIPQTLNPYDLLTAAYHYTLPPDLIAQAPAQPRDHARLLVVKPDQYSHSYFFQLADWLQSGDLLVVNDTKVIPARLYGCKPSGAQIEILLLEPIQSDQWLALVKPGRRIRVGDELIFAAGLQATVEELDPTTGGRILRFTWPESVTSFIDLLEQIGKIPLPPYITQNLVDPSEYQTVWACSPGSAAAPTAGLHFTQDLLVQLQQAGIQTTSITLNIGLGTFRPVETDVITEHTLHSEWLIVSAETIKIIQETQAQGRRVIAVGTTVVRALETAAQSGKFQPWQGKSQLFIYPGYSWRVIDGLITNFHLPQSSLLMLVSALIGRERLLELYKLAIADQYRFYSFGDGMLILPERVC